MTPIQPAPIPASTPQPNETEGSQKRALPSSLLPNQVQKPQSKSSTILSTADLRKQIVIELIEMLSVGTRSLEVAKVIPLVNTNHSI